MNPPQRIIFTVTNDLQYDQRMHRICSTLAQNGYEVLLVGREQLHSLPNPELDFAQVRLRCWWHKGFLFYAEYNIRLFFFLLHQPFDAVCSIDLDTLPAGGLSSFIKRKKRVFDAHEYFTEVIEVVNRPVVKYFWSLVAQLFVPFYRDAYTVAPALAGIFTKIYGIPFAIVKNVPFRRTTPILKDDSSRILLYQGALNEGRGIESLIDMMPNLPDCFELWLAGEGDLSESLRTRAKGMDRIKFLGFVAPADLKSITDQAWLGLNLLENKGLSYYYSLANKFFDYVQAQVPVLNMNFPEYAAFNVAFETAILLDDLSPDYVAQKIIQLHQSPDRYKALQNACAEAAKIWNWEEEQTVLLGFWRQV